MTAFDWICLTILGASLLLGMWRGFVYEALAIASWVMAFLAARWAAAEVGGWLPMGDSSEDIRYAAGFVLVFIGAAFLGGMLALALSRAASALGMRPVDRIFGAVFGLLRGAVLLLVAAVIIGKTPLREQPWWTESASAPWLEKTLADFQHLLPESLAKYLSA